MTLYKIPSKIREVLSLTSSPHGFCQPTNWDVFVGSEVDWSVKLRSYLELVVMFRKLENLYQRPLYAFTELCLQLRLVFTPV